MVLPGTSWRFDFMAHNNQINSFHLDLKMFALANSKELLNRAAMIVCQKCIDFQADLMTFSSVKENKPDWYAFEYAKKRATGNCLRCLLISFSHIKKHWSNVENCWETMAWFSSRSYSVNWIAP